MEPFTHQSLVTGIFLVVVLLASRIHFLSCLEDGLSVEPSAKASPSLRQIEETTPPNFSVKLFETTKADLSALGFKPLCNYLSQTLLEQGTPNFISVYQMSSGEIISEIAEFQSPTGGCYLDFSSFFANDFVLTTTNHPDAKFLASEKRKVIEVSPSLDVRDMFQMHWSELCLLRKKEIIQLELFRSPEEYLAFLTARYITVA